MSEELKSYSCIDLIRRLADLFQNNLEEEVDECLDWFLYTYSPEHAYHMVQANSDALKDPLLLDIAMNKIREIYEPEIFLETLNVLSSTDSYEQDLASSGAVLAVLTMMERDLTNPRSQSLGCKTVSNLCTDPDVREWIGKIKGVSRVMEVLKHYHEVNSESLKHGSNSNGEVLVEALTALGNLAFCCQSNKNLMSQERAVNVVHSIIIEFKSFAKIVNATLCALRNVVSRGEKYSDMIIRDIIMIMALHFEYPEIQVNGIWVLVNIISGRDDLKHIVSSDLGGLEHILKMMNHYKAKPELQLAAVTFLALASKQSSVRLLLHKFNSLPLFIDILERHTQFIELQRAVIKLVFRLSFNKSIRDDLARLNIVSHIVGSMKSNPDNPPLQRMAIICLCQLAKTPSLRTAVQQQAVSYMILARNKFSYIPHVHSVACIGVESMVVSDNAVSSFPSSPSSPISNSTPSRSSPPSGSRVDSLQNEIRLLKQNNGEKDNVIEGLELNIKNLQNELEKLKAQYQANFNDNNPHHKNLGSNSKNNIMQSLREEIESVTKMIEKTHSEVSQLEEDIRSLSPSMQKKVSASDDGDDKVSTPKETKKRSKSSAASDSSDSKKKHTKKTNKKEERKSQGPSSSSSSSSSSNGKKPNTKTKEKTDKLHFASPRPAISMESDVADIGLTSSSSSSPRTESDSGNTRPTMSNSAKPMVRTSSRSLKRSHVNTSGLLANAEEVNELNKLIAELKQKLQNKENELSEATQKTNTLNTQSQKLNIEYQAARVLIHNLQKESVSQTENRQAAAATVGGGGVALSARHQKQLKSLRQSVSTLESENQDLKKEIELLKGGSSSSGSVGNNQTPNSGSNTPSSDSKDKKKKKH
eukprot:TRINITY_DN837_c0_g1_i1.p1 TRINITY_DN837_c0_g1~~TRINITY_DN837_c0_g1_i1.p1  ORF type:complete len:871 (-),score=208.94 TRINITY_DN837_c0_g1_i1:230-2842(-)